MTRRATFTQAELVRAIRAAEAAGKVARWTPGGRHGNERRRNGGTRRRSCWQISEEVMENQHVANILAIPGGLSATQKSHGNPARVGKSRPISRQWVTGAGVTSLAVVILAACVPTVDRADCTDGATWRDACSRDRAAVERPEPEPGGHWATRDNEPNSRTDPEGHRDWQRDRDAQREEGTW